MKLRIGEIPYANLFPIFHVLRRDMDCSDYTFLQGVPSKVNRMLRDGEIDLSPSSSIEYLRNPSLYGIIEGHSISSRGTVQSILLFTRRPLEALGESRIAVTSQSETSVGLLRVIMERFYESSCSLQVSDQPAEEKEADAFLLIGDDALRMREVPLGMQVFDLGEVWYRHTGLPFVFALWVFRRDIDTPEGLLQRFTADLDRAKQIALRDLKGIAAHSPLRSHMTDEEIVSYWKVIDYGLSEENRKGLELFRAYLTGLDGGLCL
ncbi:MAG: menaquinone biosynthesis protein [Nitrospirales bacterium]|nr:menaquinone biosynthesis protein [Nitrospirales bacterium]